MPVSVWRWPLYIISEGIKQVMRLIKIGRHSCDSCFKLTTTKATTVVSKKGRHSKLIFVVRPSVKPHVIILSESIATSD